MIVELEGAKVTIEPSLKLGLTKESAQKLRYVSHLYVPESKRRQGIGTRLMEKIIADYDPINISLLVHVKPEDETITVDDLELFYSNLGFVRLQDEPLLMVRHPLPMTKVKSTALAIVDVYGNRIN